MPKRFHLPSLNVHNTTQWGNYEHVDPIFENWSVPDISEPANIVQLFPVVLTEIAKNTYSVTWHVANLSEWRNTRAESWHEFQDYEEYALRRLKYSLAVHSDYYEVVATERPDELIRFVYLKNPQRTPKRASPKHLTNKKASPNKKNTTRNNSVPKFFLLNDIKNHFPVVWHKDPRNPKLLGIEIHKAKLNQMAKNSGKTYKEVEAALVPKLIRALENSEVSGSWKVMAPERKEFVCMLQLLK